MLNEALRSELTDASVLGPSAVHGSGDCIELRGGRIIPSVEIARSELVQLRRVSKRLASRALDTLIDFSPPFPTPTQLKRITLNEVTGCWELPVSPSEQRRRDGYGRLGIQGITNPSGLAHRSMYQLYFGLDSLPNGRHDVLDHICEHKPCCFPRHLEKVTNRENTRRGRVISHGIESLF